MSGPPGPTPGSATTGLFVEIRFTALNDFSPKRRAKKSSYKVKMQCSSFRGDLYSQHRLTIFRVCVVAGAISGFIDDQIGLSKGDVLGF